VTSSRVAAIIDPCASPCEAVQFRFRFGIERAGHAAGFNDFRIPGDWAARCVSLGVLNAFLLEDSVTAKDITPVLFALRQRSTSTQLSHVRQAECSTKEDDASPERMTAVTGPGRCRTVDFRVLAVGGNTHQLPSSCLKKNNACAPAGDNVSTHT
jgi:hypothetical protein